MTSLPRYSSGSSPFPAVKEGDLFYTTVHARNIALVRKLLEVVLPVSYSDDFYAKLPLTPQELTKLVYYKDICVGVIGCNLESAGAGAAPSGVTAGAGEGGGSGTEGAPPAPTPTTAPVDGKRRRVYLTVLAVLAPYRDRGIGSALLKQVLDALAEGKGALADVEELYLHVSVENKEALAFYERAGFVRDAEVVKGYYRKLENPDAVVLRKAIVTAVAASQGMD